MQPLTPDDPTAVGPFRLLTRLGAGGMGQVYLGRDASGATAAVKVVRADIADDPRFRARFAREVRTAQKVRGPFTPAVMAADPDAPVPWMATAYVPGPTLKQAVGDDGPLPPRSLTVLAIGLARALRSIHEAGLMHRDLKPGNVLLSPSGPQVIDFGIARAVEGTVLTREGEAFGTPSYAPPEQIMGQETSPRSDVFSLAGVVVFAATGQGAFGRGPAEAVMTRVLSEEPRLSEVPGGPLRDLLARCLDRDPARRPDADDLVRALSGLPLPSADEGWLPASVTQTIQVRDGELRAVIAAPSRQLPEPSANATGTRRPPRHPVGPTHPVPAPQPPHPSQPSHPAGATDTTDATGRTSPHPPRPGRRRRTRRLLAAGSGALALVTAAAVTAVVLADRSGGGPDAAVDPSPSESPSAADASDDEEGTGTDALTGDVSALTFVPSGLLVTTTDTVTLWDWETGELLRDFGPAVGDVAVGASGTGATTARGGIALWSTEDPDETGFLRPEDDQVSVGPLDVSADGARVAASSRVPDGDNDSAHTVRIQDTGTGESVAEFEHYRRPDVLRFSPDGAYLVLIDQYAGTTILLDAETLEPVRTFEYSREADQTGVLLSSPEVAFHPAEPWFALTADRYTVHLYDLATQELLRTFQRPQDTEHSVRVDTLAFSADGSTLMSGEGYEQPTAGDGSGFAWDTGNGELLADSRSNLFHVLAAGPDGDVVATVQWPGEETVLFLDPDTFDIVGDLS
ncbi:WD40 repeat domain-containing serine/threonine protein kinase [Nocardiopsis aegyptia]|uniref:WD40 repeat domain-containing serine/threonine protein kinase n=1 Tax=Nocardiopsis aegyptia TaxID=220378 RepID=UPI00366CE702